MELQFYKILKQLRLNKGISQFQLAKEIGCSQSIITKWELNQREPTAQALINLSKFFNVSMEYLLGIDENTTKDIVINLVDNNINANPNNITLNKNSIEIEEYEVSQELIEKRKKLALERKKVIEDGKEYIIYNGRKYIKKEDNEDDF